MHYSTVSSQSVVPNKTLWIDQSPQTQPPLASSRQWTSPTQFPHGDRPFFSDPSTPTSSIRKNLGGPSLHSLIDYDPAGRVYYDLRYPTTQIRFRTTQPVNLRQPATDPVVDRMAVRVPGTPWVLNIQNPQGVVTVENVLMTLYNELQRIVGRGEYPTFPVQSQNHASAIFRARTRWNHTEHVQGIKRIDFLCGKSLFLGFTRATDGSDTWVMRVAENS